MSPPASAHPKDAATVVLVREGATAANGVEVFLAKRHEGLGFFGGAHVFPGGRVDAADAAAPLTTRVHVDATWLARLEPTPATQPGGVSASPSASAALGPAGISGFAGGGAASDRSTAAPGPSAAASAANGVEPRQIALGVAACRELFEEAGVLIACRAGGGLWPAPADLSGVRARAHLERLAELRAELHTGALDFAGVLTALDVVVDLTALVYWAHWVTPSFEKKRFDTRFFVAAMPPAQEASVDARESVAHSWLTVGEALSSYTRGDIVLPPPTFRNLEELGELGSPSSTVGVLLAAARARRVLPILPKIGMTPEGPAVVLPWDSTYAGLEGEVLVPQPSYDADLTGGVSRIVMQDGRWRSARG